MADLRAAPGRGWGHAPSGGVRPRRRCPALRPQSRGPAIELRHGIPEGAIEAFAFAHPQIEDVTTGRISRAAWVEMIGRHLDSADAASEWGSQPSRVDPEILELAAELRAE